jgi:hypothetical protein
MRFASDRDRLAYVHFFADREPARGVFGYVAKYIDGLANTNGGDVVLRATKSHVAFKRSSKFAWVHQATLDGAIWLAFLSPTLVTSTRVRSGPVGKRWSTHVKITSVDAEVKRWLKRAYEADEGKSK